MDVTSTSTLMIALAVLLVLSGFFSLAETAMMAANRLRLKHRAQRGSDRRAHRAARCSRRPTACSA